MVVGGGVGWEGCGEAPSFSGAGASPCPPSHRRKQPKLDKGCIAFTSEGFLLPPHAGSADITHTPSLLGPAGTQETGQWWTLCQQKGPCPCPWNCCHEDAPPGSWW